MTPSELSQLLGRVDVYLLDQILKGNIDLGAPILDAGCGGGRNTIYFMRQGAEVYGIDVSNEAVLAIRELAEHLNYPFLDRFQEGNIDQIPHSNAFFGSVICNAVLHFSEDKVFFKKAVKECWRVLKPGGLLFVRTAVVDGVENQVVPIKDRPGWYNLPDGTARFLVNVELMKQIGEELQGILVQPIRSVVLHNMRSMGTWVLQKGF